MVSQRLSGSQAVGWVFTYVLEVMFVGKCRVGWPQILVWGSRLYAVLCKSPIYCACR